mgnify:FL=1
MTVDFAIRRGLGTALTAAGVATLLLLTGCASTLDPEEARQSLSDVTEDPAPPAADETYDATLPPDPAAEPQDCAAVLVITARGTGEPTKGQLLSPVARAVTKEWPDDVTSVDLDYPADTDVKEGGTRGVRLLIDTLNVQSEACPDQQTVLLGYSQGAMVIGDALVQPEDRMIGATVGELTESARDQVLAVVLYGDPRFEGDEPFNIGPLDAALKGIMPRPHGSPGEFAERISDFCVAGDVVCQTTLDVSEDEHVAYYTNGMQQDGADVVIERLEPLLGDADDSDDSDEPTPTKTAETR